MIYFKKADIQRLLDVGMSPIGISILHWQDIYCHVKEGGVLQTKDISGEQCALCESNKNSVGDIGFCDTCVLAKISACNDEDSIWRCVIKNDYSLESIQNMIDALFECYYIPTE